MSLAHIGKKKGPQSVEHRIRIGLALRGHHLSIETRKKMSVEALKKDYSYMVGRKMPDYVKKKISDTKKGIPISDLHRKKLSIVSRSGSNSIWWKGGISPLNRKIRRSLRMKLWRKSIFERDDYTCQDCGNRGGYLEAHHIKEFSVLLKELDINSLQSALGCKKLWSIANGKTLCKFCHRKTFGINKIKIK